MPAFAELQHLVYEGGRAWRPKAASSALNMATKKSKCGIHGGKQQLFDGGAVLPQSFPQPSDK